MLKEELFTRPDIFFNKVHPNHHPLLAMSLQMTELLKFKYILFCFFNFMLSPLPLTQVTIINEAFKINSVMIFPPKPENSQKSFTLA